MSHPFTPDTFEYAVCLKCARIHSSRESVCRNGCDDARLEDQTWSLLEVMNGELRVCTSCHAYYDHFAHINVCKQCQGSLTRIAWVPSHYALPRNSIASYDCPKCSRNQSLQTPFCDVCGRMLRIEIEYFDLDDDRPTIPVKLRYPDSDKTVLSILLIDFDATHTLLHGSLARQLGIPFEEGTPYQFTGIAPEVTVTGWSEPM